MEQVRKIDALISRRDVLHLLLFGLVVALLYWADATSSQRKSDPGRDQEGTAFDRQIDENAQAMLDDGKRIFRFDTFGDEAFWTGALKLHRAIVGKAPRATVLPTRHPRARSAQRQLRPRGGATRRLLFSGQATCAQCHVPPTYTEPGWNMHTPAEVGIDDFQAKRSPDERYRTSPLRGLWTHQTGGFYHDGRFATLLDVVNHYNTFGHLNLTAQDKRDLVEFLKSL